MDDTNIVNNEYEKTPHQLGLERMDVANEYIEMGKRMAELKTIKAMWWKACREDYKSDTSTER